jgi:chromosome segregation ATPase
MDFIINKLQPQREVNLHAGRTTRARSQISTSDHQYAAAQSTVKRESAHHEDMLEQVTSKSKGTTTIHLASVNNNAKTHLLQEKMSHYENLIQETEAEKEKYKDKVACRNETTAAPEEESSEPCSKCTKHPDLEQKLAQTTEAAEKCRLNCNKLADVEKQLAEMTAATEKSQDERDSLRRNALQFRSRYKTVASENAKLTEDINKLRHRATEQL